MEIFGFKAFMDDSILVSEDSPELFCKKCIVQSARASKPQPTLGFTITKGFLNSTFNFPFLFYNIPPRIAYKPCCCL